MVKTEDESPERKRARRDAPTAPQAELVAAIKREHDEIEEEEAPPAPAVPQADRLIAPMPPPLTLNLVIRVDVVITNFNSQSSFSGYSSTSPRSAAVLIKHFNAFMSTFHTRIISLNMTERTRVAVVSTDLGCANLEAPLLHLVG
ncbi:hypothetical protein AUEXF2481DRAFT_32944 [Aureobasidium subglaciale EXF-2481]|uniref:Uncharacterized protein n=1 Tax=Aureobasidium subglaciale (strain EXF-2481) TaxID=1043005 RepID=A0A074YXK0_AURSE|nr:uncharacterized protein AUEXF2481DRAFT_32944 [Aureobasidium subglaciale EXF-2481]KEQ91561.1 hypothetical protein AUEXF2481DRAFT_32944 [Aureobasidium subglaciale EXF-2481]